MFSTGNCFRQLCGALPGIFVVKRPRPTIDQVVRFCECIILEEAMFSPPSTFLPAPRFNGILIAEELATGKMTHAEHALEDK